ncbi:hypothetical protein MRB53_014258 [Persea americana]|uniref:Uncharacterized protein n=1 Tax=Persea americana TaxID=3435 RepID=A0ACC2KAD5_PERAE|nr:hypothetical protein MRB53_014258 [Persea americana]
MSSKQASQNPSPFVLDIDESRFLGKLSLRKRFKGTGPLTAYCQRNSNLFHGIRWVFTSFGKEPDEILACVG